MIKHFSKKHFKIAKNNDVSTSAKRHYQVEKIFVCCRLSIPMDDKKLNCKKKTIVIIQKVWHVWSPSGYLNWAKEIIDEQHFKD